jgi:hypothetical protein
MLMLAAVVYYLRAYKRTNFQGPTTIVSNGMAFDDITFVPISYENLSTG